MTNSALGENRQEFETIHQFLDEYNGHLQREFSIIHERLFPNVWKFGYANVDYSEDRIAYGLYPIPWQKNDVQIKDIDLPNEGSALRQENLSQLTHYGYNPFAYGVEEHAMRELKDDIEDVISDRWLRHYENDFLCREVVFAFVDEFAQFMGLEEKQEYRLEELDEGFYQYLQLWVDTALDQIDESEFVSSPLDENRLPWNLYWSLTDEEKEDVTQTVEELVEDDEGLGFRYRISTHSVSDRIVDEALSTLRRRGFETIEQPYPSPDIEPSTDDVTYTWDSYSESAIEEITKTYWRNLVKAYRQTAEASFPEMAGVFDDFQEITDIVVEVDVKSKGDRAGPDYHYHQLKKDDGGDVSVQFRRMSSPDDKRIEAPLERDTVNYRGDEYEWLGSGSTPFSVLLETAPLLEEVYRRINDDLQDEYFRGISSMPHVN